MGIAIDAGAELCNRCESSMIFCFSVSDNGECTTSLKCVRNESFSSANRCTSWTYVSCVAFGDEESDHRQLLHYIRRSNRRILALTFILDISLLNAMTSDWKPLISASWPSTAFFSAVTLSKCNRSSCN